VKTCSYLFFSIDKPYMAQTISHKKRIAHAMALLTLVGIASSCAFVMTAVASGIVPSDVITLANSARIKSGLNPLQENAKLAQAAQAKADDMIKNDYFSHTSPRASNPGTGSNRLAITTGLLGKI
jgi:uncharacterized protein YkwD